MSAIHSTAIVASTARIAADVEIGPFCVIGEDVEIGAGTRLDPHVVIHSRTVLGQGCRAHAGVVLGDLPQDLSFGGGVSRVRIGDRCAFREGVTIHRGTKPDTETVVGDDCYLMANSHLAHNVILGRGVILANGALLAGYVEVGDRAFISGNAVVHQFTRIGRLAMLSGLSGIGMDVPPFCTTRGVHVNRVAGLNVVGMRRAGMSPADRKDVKTAFRILYREGLNVSQAIERLRGEFPSGPAAEFREFLESSRRGICPAAMDLDSSGD